MKGLWLAIPVTCYAVAFAATAVAASTYEIWNGPPPGSENWTHSEITFMTTLPAHEGEAASQSIVMVRDVVTPTLTAYFPELPSATHTAVIICPGGGLRFLTWEIEGTNLAQWLAAHGVSAFVLKYRLVPTPSDPTQFEHESDKFFREFSQAISGNKRPRSFEEMLPDAASRQARQLASADAQQAVKYVRSHAREWGISPDRIGMLGFSAGAFLVTDAIFSKDPDSALGFAALIYGGEAGDRRIPPTAPPLFMVVAQDDRWMSGIARDLFSQWDRAGKPVELHYFEKGGHGFGTSKQNAPIDEWVALLGRWMASRGLM
jgi:acetyl esterase/lipase